MKRLVSLLAAAIFTLSALAQPSLKDISITATRSSDYNGEVRLTATLSCENKGKIGQIKTRIFNRFEEPGRTVNRLVAESINYQLFTDGASVIQTFKVNNVPDEDSPFIAKTVVTADDGSETVIETPFSFGTRVVINP